MAAQVVAFGTDTSTYGLGTTLRSQAAGFNIPAGSFVWAGLALQQGGVVPSSASDGTNTYTILSGTSQGGEDSFIIYCANAAAVTGAVITVTFPSDVRYKVIYGEVLSGMATSGVLLDNDAGNSDGATVTTGSMTWGSTAVIVGVCCSTNDRTWTNGEGMTELYDVSTALGSGSGGFYRELDVAAGSGTRSFSPLSASNSSAVVAAFLVASSDTTAPVLSSPTGSATGSTTATVGVTTDEDNGTLYAVVTTSSTQPSIAQIKAGQDHTGSTAVASGSQAVSSTGAKTFNATGLSPTTAYYAHLVHTDAAANDSNRVSSAAFTTFQRSVPSSDVAAGSWTPSAGATLFGVLDEAAADDADFISSSTLGDSCTVGLGTLTDPASSAGHIVSYRLRGDGVSGVTVSLMQGAAAIASWTHDPAPAGFTTFAQTLTGTQADSITDYTALRLRFTEV